MDFIKNNLFYVILVAVILVVSVPSFILASARQSAVRIAASDADIKLSNLKQVAKNLKPISAKALKEADGFRKEWEDQRAKVQEMLKAANKHLDEDFLVPPDKPGDTPDPVKYKTAYNQAYDKLIAQLAGHVNPKDPSFSTKADFGDRLPTPDEMRISQKQYWILKELADILSNPECGVREITDVTLDFVPNDPKAANRPDDAGRFWIYPMRLEFKMDFTCFAILMQKLTEDKNLTFFINGYTITRGFDESKPVYTPFVAVVLYCQVWDYISTPFEQKNLADWRAAKGAKKPGAAAAAAPPGRAAPAPGGGAAAGSEEGGTE